ncbi:MAG: OmpA family protein [Acidimicrobiales bacterium]
MSGFFDDLVAAATADGPVDALTAGDIPVDRQAMRAGAVLASAAVVAELARLGDGGGRWTWQRLLRPGAAAGGPDGSERGESLIRMLFGDRVHPVTASIARDASLPPAGAELVLRTATQAAVSLLIARAGRGDQPDLRAEADALAASGWGRWLATLTPEPTAAPTADAALAREPAPEPPRAPEPTAEAAAAADAEPVAEPGLVVIEPEDPGVVALAPTAPATPLDPVGPPDNGEPTSDERPSRGLLIAGALTVVVAALVALAVSTRFGGDTIDSGAGTTVPSTTAAPGSEGIQGSGVELATATTDGEPGDDAGTSVTAPAASTVPGPESPVGPTTYRLALADPRGSSDAAGTVRLDLDPATGEICYEIEVAGLTDPFPGHVHAAPVGASGGITVDFGYLTGPAPSGCVDSFPADVADVIRHPERHYVELHDTEYGFGIRSRLAEAAPTTAGPGATPGAGAGTGIGTETAAATVLDAGRVVLRGAVPDEATRSALVADAADLRRAGFEVVDELTVRAGAPPPSGQVLVEQPLLFPFDSNELPDDAARSVDELARILQLRPEWRITLVGNTDGVGDIVYNLTLSLRRAIAARNTLVAAGVAPEAVTIRGDGPFAPVADNDTPDGRTRNRRIDVVITTTP